MIAKPLIVGSCALKHYGLARKEPKDLDLWVYDKTQLECVGAEVDCSVLPKAILDSIPCEGNIPSLNALYTIKCSHLAWDIHWQKTKLDILWLKSNGCTLIPELYIKLKNYWEGVHGDKSFLSLKQSSEDFFDDKVKYVYDHDYLHELVSYPEEPMYKSLLKEGEKVLLCKDKFDKLPFNRKVKLFREEITVIACERWLINPTNQGKFSWTQAYKLALKKTITNLTKGWACDFIISNLDQFNNPDISYFKYLFTTLKLKEKFMSYIDLSIVFKALKHEGDNTPLEELVLEMCEGDLWSLDEAKLQDMGLEYTHLHQEGGGEGGSEDCYGVFKLGDKIYRSDYSYYSYEGHRTDNILEELREVKPVEKTITIYE